MGSSLVMTLGSVRRCPYDVRPEDSPRHVPMDDYGDFCDSIPTFVVYGTRGEHLGHLRLCLEQCRTSSLILNPTKCAFGVTSGALLGHIVSKEGITIDLNKIKAIIEAKTPTNAKILSCILGQIRWHSRMLRYLADFATPLRVVVHRTPFKWMTIEDKAYEALKIMLNQAPVV